MNTCKKCGKDIPVGYKFCSRSCSAKYNNVVRCRKPWSAESKKRQSDRFLGKGFGRYVKAGYKEYTCRYCGKKFTREEYYTLSAKYCSAECAKLRVLEWKRQTGGYKAGAGRGKSGWYKGIHCDSTWELAFVIYCLDHDLQVERCKEVRDYKFQGKIHRYYPDFIVEGRIIEIKGYKTEQWEAKISQNPDIIVLGREDIKQYLVYIQEKYSLKGLELVKLYDYRKSKK